ncbi:hypothetical protein TNCV_534631 [Trichonephila clavipes]|nr:hypothetical protein TNCV_534631 [Trichonephila clavipes]
MTTLDDISWTTNDVKGKEGWRNIFSTPLYHRGDEVREGVVGPKRKHRLLQMDQGGPADEVAVTRHRSVILQGSVPVTLWTVCDD